MDNIRHHAPDVQAVFVTQHNRIVFFILWLQGNFAAFYLQSFDRQIVINACNYNVTMLRFNGPINDENIAGLNVGIDHGIAFGHHHEGLLHILDKEFVEIDIILNMILQNEGEPAGTPDMYNGMRCRLTFLT